MTPDQFDEAAYLQYYEDIQHAINEGTIQGAWWHYDNIGRAEGRKAFIIEHKFDEDFYLRAYPIVAAEIQAGKAESPHDHYLKLGKGRGFLKCAKASRPDNAAEFPSPFGGLWPDAANARDLVEGKLEIGQITERQAELLISWISDGYVILEQAIPLDLIDAVTNDLDRALAGEFPEMRFECHPIASGLTDWTPEIVRHPSKAIDLHFYSPAAQTLMFAEPITEFLGLIFESKAFASQTLGYWRGSGMTGHQDTAHMPYTIPRQFAASWVALEDVAVGAGELFCYPGSHRFPDFLYCDRFKSVEEAVRCGYTVEKEEEETHETELLRRVKALKIEKKTLRIKKGDVLFWHADLVHGGNPVSANATRKSFVTHYCPKRISPVFSEQSNTEICDHEGHIFTTRQTPGE